MEPQAVLAVHSPFSPPSPPQINDRYDPIHLAIHCRESRTGPKTGLCDLVYGTLHLHPAKPMLRREIPPYPDNRGSGDDETTTMIQAQLSFHRRAQQVDGDLSVLIPRRVDAAAHNVRRSSVHLPDVNGLVRTTWRGPRLGSRKIKLGKLIIGIFLRSYFEFLRPKSYLKEKGMSSNY